MIPWYLLGSMVRRVFTVYSSFIQENLLQFNGNVRYEGDDL